MSSLRLLLTGFVFLTLLTSCFPDGVLRIRNQSSLNLEVQVNYMEPVYLSSEQSWSKSMTGESNAKVQYTCNHVFTKTRYIEIQSGKTTTLDIVADAGAIRIYNNSGSVISEVYLSPSTSLFWGSNQLEGFIYAYSSALWTVYPKSWDIKVVDIQGNTYYRYDQLVDLDQTVSINLGKLKMAESLADKKINSRSGVFETERKE